MKTPEVTSAKVASLATRILRSLPELHLDDRVTANTVDICTVSELYSIAVSALTQQTKGTTNKQTHGQHKT